MAASGFPALDSYSAAVVFLPPTHLQSPINLLRSANDKSFPRWPPHLTVLFPFVHPSALNDAASRLRSALHAVSHEPFTLNLDHVGQFSNRSYNTVYLAPSSHATAQIQSVFKTISIASGYKGRPFVPHATIGQARSDREMSLLQEKGALMLRNHNLSWDLGSVVILSKDEADGGKMKIYEEIPLKEGSVLLAKIISDRPLTFTAVDGGWTPATMSDIPSLPNARLRVISMNILHDDTHAPRLRFDLLKRVMLSHTPHLLCLQEVPDDFLPLLLSDPDIQSRYRYSTCGSSSVLPNLQNIVALSSLPFTWESLVLNDKHKAASILTFAFSRPLIVVVIHFTAGHTPPRQAKREVEAAALLAHLRTHHAGTEWIIVGDMNLDTDSLPVSWPDMDDAWTLCHPGQSGETYDPIRNALAADTVREVKTAFRYDRLCVQKGSSIQVERVDIVKAAADERPASDHWALFSELDMSSLLDASRFTNHPTLAERITVDGGGGGSISLGADAVLEAWARANGGYPSHDQEVARTRAIQTIRQVLGGASSNSTDVSYPASAPLPSGVKVILEPVGSHMLSVDTAASDIDMLAVGNLGQRTFFDLMRARIRAWARACAAARVPCTLVLRRFVRDAAVPMLRLQVHGVEVDLQYAPAAMVAERWVEVPNLSSEDSLFSLPAPTLRVLNAYRDSQRILALLSNERLPSFRLALRALKLFIAARGLSGAKFGFLGGIHLTLLLARVALSDAPDDTFTASEMLSTFISRYAHFPFTEEIVAIEGVAVGSTYRRTPREALAILSVERPLINVAAGATVPNVAAIQEEFVRADALLHTANESWAAICGTPGDSAQTFMSGYPAYVKVDLSFWGVDATRMRALLGYVESRLVKLIVDLDRHGASNPRLWPQPFVDGGFVDGDAATSGLDRTLNLSYLIGVRGSAADLAANSALSDFERLVHGQETYYDPTEAYFGVTATKSGGLADLQVAPTTIAWIDGGVDPVEEDEDNDFGPRLDSEPEAFVDATNAVTAKPTQARGGKLRTSADVYNRLMWDPHADRADYAVGYEDRFVGVMEMPLTNWKREVEDEAFVPFHRVVHFRRVSDGMLVWDRRNRVDMVFGSGGAEVGDAS